MTGTIREIRRGTADELGPLAPGETRIRIVTDVPDTVHQRLADCLADRPDVVLQLEVGDDLEVLHWYPGLRRLASMSLRLRSLDGIGHVADTIDDLTLGDTLRPASLRPIRESSRLRRLAINGTWRDLDTVSALVDLERLAVGSVDLESLLPLRSLRRFESGLGTIRSMDRLPEIGRLELVELWRLRGEHDLTSLGAIPSLTYLILSSTRSVTALPSFAGSPALRWVSLEEMRGITDLRPVAAAPNLEVLLLVGMRQLAVDDLRPLVGHPALRAGIWGLGSKRRNAEAAELLPLPPANGGPPPWTEPEWIGVPQPTDV